MKNNVIMLFAFDFDKKTILRNIIRLSSNSLYLRKSCFFACLIFGRKNFPLCVSRISITSRTVYRNALTSSLASSSVLIMPLAFVIYIFHVG